MKQPVRSLANIVTKKTWVTAEILDLCDRRELTKKRFEPEGSEKYREVNNNIKRCMKKAKENWTGEQCNENEENLRKNNSKWAYQLVKTWSLWNKGKLLLSKIVQENASKTNDRYWTDGKNTTLSCTIRRPVEIHQYWTVPKQTQRITTPSFTKKWRLQYNHWRKRSQLESTPSGAGPGGWRGCGHRSHDKLVSWYFEQSHPQRVTSWLKTMFNLAPIYSARKSSNHTFSINHKISHDTNLHKTKHTQTSDTKFLKN